MPTHHSTFPASSASRLLACPGAYQITQDLDTGVRKSSVFSSQGTLAHTLSETCLMTGTDPVMFIGQTRHADGFDHEIDEEFVEAVNTYVDFIRGLQAMGYLILLEHQVSPQVHWTDPATSYPDIHLFGTADCIAWHPGTNELLIVDLKFGKGVPVEVANNAQLKYYAAGALHADVISEILLANVRPQTEYKTLPTSIKTVIIQPRALHSDGPIRSMDYTAQEIIDFATKDLVKGVEIALADGGKTRNPGKHCRFCPGATSATCTALHDLTFNTAKAAFAGTPIENIPAIDEPGAVLPQAHLDDKTLADLLDKIEIISPWLDAVKRLAQERAEQGRDVPGWKLVPKRAFRRFADDADETMKHLAGRGLFPEDFSEVSLLSPAKIEKKIGKARYEQDVKPYVVKTSTGNTLAPDGDPRARIQKPRSAQEAFGSPPGQSNNANDW